MREFFRGWKRKTGVLTLGMACVFAGLWVRSSYVWDSAGFPNLCGIDFGFDSSTGAFRFYVLSPSSWEPGIVWDVTPLSDDPELQLDERKLLPLFIEIHAKFKNRILYKIAMTYWLIVVPLTLLSAWLLLSKPRATPDSIPKIADAASDGYDGRGTKEPDSH